MQNNKLISILSHFSKVEQNRLRKYIISPYFNVNTSLVDLFDCFISNLNSRTEKIINKEEIWNRLFPNKDFEDVRFRKLNSDLLKLVEGFLAQETFQKDQLNKSIYLLNSIKDLKLEKLYSGAIKSARRFSEQQNLRSSEYHYSQYLIESNSYDIFQFDLDRSSKTNLEEIVKKLDHFYLTEKLKFSSSIQSRKNVASHEYAQSNIENIRKFAEKYDLEKIPSAAIYYQVLLTQIEIDVNEHYFRLKSLLEKHISIFANDELKEIYNYAINYCIFYINKGDRKFLEEFIDLNEFLLEKGIIGDDELSPWRFRNIVSAALRLGKYNWTNEFIITYHKKLPHQYRGNARTFNLAQLHFYQKDYGKVIELLRTVEFEDFTYNLVSKSILLATYYEEDEIEPLMSLLSSFRTYLNRHKDIPASRRKSYLDLIKYLKKLTRIQPRDKKNLQKLKEEVESTKGIASESWLKEKIAELE